MVLDSDSSEDDAIPAVKYSEPTAKSFPVYQDEVAAAIPVSTSSTEADYPNASFALETLLPIVYPFKEPATSLPVAVGAFDLIVVWLHL